MKKLVAMSFVFFSSSFILHCTTTEEAAAPVKADAATLNAQASEAAVATDEQATKTEAAVNAAEAGQTGNRPMMGKGKGMHHKGMRPKMKGGSHAHMKDPALHEKLAKAHMDAANCLKAGKTAKECEMVMPPEAGKGMNKKAMKAHSHEHFTQEMHASMAEVHGKVATCLKEGKPAAECTKMLDACPMAGKDDACRYNEMDGKGPGKKQMEKAKGKTR